MVRKIIGVAVVAGIMASAAWAAEATKAPAANAGREGMTRTEAISRMKAQVAKLEKMSDAEFEAMKAKRKARRDAMRGAQPVAAGR